MPTAAAPPGQHFRTAALGAEAALGGPDALGGPVANGAPGALGGPGAGGAPGAPATDAAAWGQNTAGALGNETTADTAANGQSAAGGPPQPPDSGPGQGPVGAGGAGPRKARQGPRSLRWLRLVVPPVAALLVMLMGTVLYQIEQPDLEDEAYLSPGSRAAIGAADLAGRVRGAGVEIIPERRSSDALVAAYSGNVTLLITTPQLMHRYYLRMLKLLPASTRVVMVEPGLSTANNGLLPFRGAARHYVARTAEPGCDYAPAAQAGAAGVVRTQYGKVYPDLGDELQRCYDGALVVYRREAVAITVVGSADPFRNDRIGEHGNAKLATALLTGAPRLVWLDLHRAEPPPGVVDYPGLAGGPAAPPSLRPAEPGEPPDYDFPIDGKRQQQTQPRTGSVNGGEGGDAGSDDPPNPLWSAFPPWTYPVTALVALGVFLLGLARARRLGAPVVEPLPVIVRSSETALGRGRLYQRAKARAESLQVLRDAAIARMVRLLRLDPAVERPLLVEAVAASSGWPPAAVGHTLFGPPPENDTDLVEAAVRLEQLVNAVTTEQPAAHAPFEGEPR
ncbi:DUF4350 domain-containing protein [Dactylosporangium sp. CA-233914]|uniref:DUF4350 domain-containing protein n=1 Tax=Dactylosporangium sp. CA-233914 TaxID=3239934 RepID=UPI003D8EABCF